MKAWLCSIGESTTDIVADQLTRYGYQVIRLEKKEPWYEKYREFIFQANETCIRIDADVIPNARIDCFQTYESGMLQSLTYDLYRNDVGVTSPTFYSKEVLDLIRKDWSLIGTARPETDASRLPEVNRQFKTIDQVVGIHGLYQYPEDVERHRQHKIERKQMEGYDFSLIDKLNKILWHS